MLSLQYILHLASDLGPCIPGLRRQMRTQMCCRDESLLYILDKIVKADSVAKTMEQGSQGNPWQSYWRTLDPMIMAGFSESGTVWCRLVLHSQS